MKEKIRSLLLRAGACAVGFAEAEAVADSEWRRFEAWLSRGSNGGMEYMRNYPELRRDPRLLLPGARTVISLAFSYAPPAQRPADLPQIALYAYGRDYHKEIRRLLKPALRQIQQLLGAESGEAAVEPSFRICVDSAPILERYWAVRSGIGIPSDNGAVIIPGHGSLVFLAEILTDLPLTPDSPMSRREAVFGRSFAPQSTCGSCGACRNACPAGAIAADSIIYAPRCLSYLTIEHRGEWTDPESRAVMRQAPDTLFGCDLCLRACPHNRNIPATPIAAFHPSETILKLTAADILAIKNEEQLRELLPNSPILRATLPGLHRNLSSKT